VIKVNSDSSVCEIVKSKLEISKGNKAYISALTYSDKRFAPHIYNLLYRVVEPYEPYKPIKVYVHESLTIRTKLRDCRIG